MHISTTIRNRIKATERRKTYYYVNGKESLRKNSKRIKKEVPTSKHMFQFHYIDKYREMQVRWEPWGL